MKTIVFFNNKGGVGKTTMVYHITWMMAELGHRVVALDFDPQSNLTSMFLSPDRIEELYENDNGNTVIDGIVSVTEGEGYRPVHIEPVAESIGIVAGNLALSTFEDRLSDAWLKCLSGDIYSFRLTSIFKTIAEDVATRWHADFVLIDAGPNLGAINRSVLLSSDFMVVPVAPDLFSLRGLKNLGGMLNEWKSEWKERLMKNKKEGLTLPEGNTLPVGYIVMQYQARSSRPVKSYLKWTERIPSIYEEFVLQGKIRSVIRIENDENCLGLLKHYHSLDPMSMEAEKPMFLLKPADGAIGAHYQAVQRCYDDFKGLTEAIISRCNK